MKKPDRAFDSIMRGLKEARAYRGELLGGAGVRVDWTVWKHSLGKSSPDFMEGGRAQGERKP